MTALLAPVLVIAGFALYMITNTQLGRFRRMPWEFIAVSASGVVVAVTVAWRSGGALAMVAAALSLGLFGLLVWFFFRFSMYGAREDRPRLGDRFPEFRLPASDGSLFDFGKARGKPHLLIFYRGSW